MARLEKRRMTESANHPPTTIPVPPTNRQTSSTLIVNGLPPAHSNNEIENLLYKHEHDPSPQFSLTLPENILLNHPITHFTPSTTSIKRPRPSDDHPGQIINGPLPSTKKSRSELLDETKLHSSSSKSTKKNRNKTQQPPLPPQTIIKTAASGIFPQQNIAVQHIEESSDDVSLRLNV